MWNPKALVSVGSKRIPCAFHTSYYASQERYTMSKRGQLVQTYGRHRQRVVNIDVWTPSGVNVFSSSDDNGSLLDSPSPSVSTGIAARLRRRGVGKENQEEGGRSYRTRRDKAGSRSDMIWKKKTPQQYHSPLCDVSNVSTVASPAETRRRKELSSAPIDYCEPSSRIDFSDIEKHSLILSDSIETSNVGWKNRSKLTTSTPHQRHAVVPSGDSDRYSTSPVSLCRSELENLHDSDVSNITTASSVDSYHDDNTISRLHRLTEDRDVSVSYDASCDMFDDAPPRRRSMYLLRSMRKGATTNSVANDSMGGSIYRPGNYTSEELSDESGEEDDDAVSNVESEDGDEDSLSDIFEEEESTPSMTSHGMMSMSSEASRTSTVGSLHQSIRVALTPCKSGCRPFTAREHVLAQCSQTDICRFTDCITPVMMKTCTKIGEGVYGEVFRAQRGGRPVALKVIPIEGNFEVNDEPQKTFEEMLPEIVISKELSALRDRDVNWTRNFVHVLGVHVVEGSYPDTLLAQWDLFHRRKGSENDRPDMYKDTQLFLVFEFADSGADLEAFQLNNLEEARSVLEQVTRALAIAEAELQFEHRDLHWGNVLVRRTDEPTISCCLNGETHEIKSAGVEVSIIDFTLSRLCQDGCYIFTDLSKDPTLFTGHGDYQFDIYRLMKDVNSNDWEPHHPFTNVLWISYLADKLIRKECLGASKNRLQHQASTRRFRTFIRRVLNYRSAVELLCKDKLFH